MPSYQSFLSAVKAEVKETDVQAVMDGDLDDLIGAYLRQFGEQAT